MKLKSINPMAGAIIGILGVLSTAVTAGYCTLRTKEALDKAGNISKQEKAAVLAKGYLPAGVCIVATSAVIVAFGTTNAKQATALAGTYAMLNRGYGKHKAEIKKLCRPLLDKEEREKLAKKYFERKKDDDTHNSALSDEHTYYIDSLDDYVERKPEDIIYAEYQLNRLLAYQGFATLNNFYDALGLAPTDDGDRLGWSYALGADHDGYQWIDVVHEEFELEDGLIATRVIFEHAPEPYFKEDWREDVPF